MSSAFKSVLNKKNEQKKQMKNSSLFEKDIDSHEAESNNEPEKGVTLAKKVKKQLKAATQPSLQDEKTN